MVDRGQQAVGLHLEAPYATTGGEELAVARIAIEEHHLFIADLDDGIVLTVGDDGSLTVDGTGHWLVGYFPTDSPSSALIYYSGHIVIRVEPGGAAFRVIVLDDAAETYGVKSIHGPYQSR